MSVYKRIEPNEISVTPFLTHKTINAISGSDIVLGYKALYQDTTYNLSDISDYDAVNLLRTTQNRYQFLIYDSINHLFYKDYIIPHSETFSANNKFQKRRLFESAFVLSVPQNQFGEQIKEETVQLVVDVNSEQRTIIDDGFGNLIDTTLSASYGEILQELNSKVVGSWNFSDAFGNKSKINSSGIVRDWTGYRHDINYEYINFNQDRLIKSAKFDGSQSLGRVEHNNRWNFKTHDDFAISIVFKSYASGTLITKDGRSSINLHDNKKFQTDTEQLFPYPFQINLNSSGYIEASRYDGKNLTVVTSAGNLADGKHHHVLFQKTGSTLELYIDGTKDDYATDLSVLSTHNNSDLFFGSKGRTRNFFSGSLYTADIYNAGLTEDTAETMYEPIISQSFDYRVGNVFYEHGLLVLTSPEEYYSWLSYTDQDSPGLPPTVDWSLTLRGQKTIYEYEILCPADSDEFNQTLNPTARENSSIDDQNYAHFTTHSLFTPYVTKIGLYNEYAELLGVATLSRPVPKIRNKDMVFVIRMDV